MLADKGAEYVGATVRSFWASPPFSWVIGEGGVRDLDALLDSAIDTEQFHKTHCQRIIEATLGALERSETVRMIEKLLELGRLRVVLGNTLAVPTDETLDRLCSATAPVLDSPRTCARLIYAFSDAVRFAVETPDIERAYYEGFQYSEKAGVSAVVPGTDGMGLKYESGYTWTPVPMLKALAQAEHLKIARFFADFRIRRLYAAAERWAPSQKREYDMEFQMWINIETGKFNVRQEYSYLLQEDVKRIILVGDQVVRD